MDGHRRMKVTIGGILAVAVVGGGLAWTYSNNQGAVKGPATVATSPAQSRWRALAEGVQQGDPRSLAELVQKVLAHPEKPSGPVSPAESADLIAVLQGLRAGFLKFAPVGRASAIAVGTHILDRYRAEGAPTDWSETLRPVHDMILAGLADPSVDVRSSALAEVGRHWNWSPGRAMTPAEEADLGSWKDAFHAPTVRCLGDREPKSRAAAVVCLGNVPIDSMAAPAVHYVEDPQSGGVRYKALMAFAARPALLTDDAVLKRLHDAEPGVPELAELILKGRGLTKDQIFLVRQMYNPRAEVRASVIPLICDRTDIDPVVWLLQLSRDADDSVRAGAVEALSDRDSPEVDRRLREMASSDTSPAVRAAAGKHVSRTTASLPPLPGSPSLNLKAN